MQKVPAEVVKDVARGLLREWLNAYILAPIAGLLTPAAVVWVGGWGFRHSQPV